MQKEKIKLKLFESLGMYVECIFLGYTYNSKAYRFMIIEPNNSIIINNIES